ncbi:MAG: tetratricopeptide repeat protein, partial [Candidatus Obscuribacterales bacterium]|nr:tetratricopeptide repeat protein [Candidatus Obscuribacterales bacterium]
IEEGMGRNQLLAEATRSMKVARTDLNTSLTHMIEKFTDSKDGEFLKMSPIARNEMIENLSTLSKEVNSTSPIAHAENLTTLARVHKFNSRREDELGLLREAQAILDKQVKLTPGRTSMEISKDRFPHERNLTDLADCYAALGIKESAISTAQRIVKLQEALHGPHAGNTVNALNNLGKVSYKVGEPTKALIAFESAAESHGYVEGINHKMFFKPTCNSLSELHQYFAGEGQVDQAKRCLELLKFWNS